MNQLDNFDKLCTQIYYWKGEFRFPFSGIKHNKKFESILKDTEYSILESKMRNLLNIINKDMSKINMDTEELWEVI